MSALPRLPTLPTVPSGYVYRLHHNTKPWLSYIGYARNRYWSRAVRSEPLGINNSEKMSVIVKGILDRFNNATFISNNQGSFYAALRQEGSINEFVVGIIHAIWRLDGAPLTSDEECIIVKTYTEQEVLPPLNYEAHQAAYTHESIPAGYRPPRCGPSIPIATPIYPDDTQEVRRRGAKRKPSTDVDEKILKRREVNRQSASAGYNRQKQARLQAIAPSFDTPVQVASTTSTDARRPACVYYIRMPPVEFTTLEERSDCIRSMRVERHTFPGLPHVVAMNPGRIRASSEFIDHSDGPGTLFPRREWQGYYDASTSSLSKLTVREAGRLVGMPVPQMSTQNRSRIASESVRATTSNSGSSPSPLSSEPTEHKQPGTRTPLDGGTTENPMVLEPQTSVRQLPASSPPPPRHPTPAGQGDNRGVVRPNGTSSDRKTIDQAIQERVEQKTAELKAYVSLPASEQDEDDLRTLKQDCVVQVARSYVIQNWETVYNNGRPK